MTTLPLLPLPPGFICFPNLILSVPFSDTNSIDAIQELLKEERSTPILLACAIVIRDSTETVQNSISIDQTSKIYNVGTVCKVVRVERRQGKGQDGKDKYILVLEGIERIKIHKFIAGNSNPRQFVADTVVTSTIVIPKLAEEDQIMVQQFQSVATSLLGKLQLPPLLYRRLLSLTSSVSLTTAPSLVDILASTTTTIEFEEKLSILRTIDPIQRLQLGIELFSNAETKITLTKKIGEKVEISVANRQREYLLLQQLKVIKEELEAIAKDDNGALLSRIRAGAPKNPTDSLDGDDGEDDLVELGRKIKEKNWSAEARKVVMKEFKRLKKSPPQGGAEVSVIRNYLEVLLSVPFTEATSLNYDVGFITAARQKLEDDHFGMEKVKKRLIEWLSVLRLKQEIFEDERTLSSEISTALTVIDNDASIVAPVEQQALRSRDKGPILLLVGPPGVGKTSIASSLAASMNRKFERISLGGVRDESELRGHRRTYVGAMNGKIVEALRRCQTNNPVILLDEIDKLSVSNQGDPAAALLEILDPNQNHNFVDHYLGIPLDLSSVIFIATANDLGTISGPLLDRMEILELPGYIHSEKLEIATRYLVPKQILSNSLPPITFPPSVLLDLITGYTREAGVRSLEREIGSICRAKAVEFSTSRDFAGIKDRRGDMTLFGFKNVVEASDLKRILGGEKYDSESSEEPIVGVSTGLAYQGSGMGGILYIECTKYPGNGSFKMTGQLGSVISESAILAFTWVKSNSFLLGLTLDPTEDVFSKIDLSIHLPSGGVKKDGPSAGVAFVVAIVSLLRNITVKPGVAMTGEITLRGRVTPVGGIKEKVIGAHRAGIRTLLLPFKNELDVIEDLPTEIRKEVEIIYLKTIWDGLNGAFGIGWNQGREIELLESRL